MADFNKTRTVADRIGNVTVISINSELRYSRHDHESMLFGNRFLSTSAMLPEGEFIGLQISRTADGDVLTVAFSSSDTLITKEDFNWIFGRCGKTETTAPLRLSNIYGEGRKVYSLVPAEGSTMDVSDVPMSGDIHIDRFLRIQDDFYDDESSYVFGTDRNEYVKEWSDELFRMLMEEGAIIRVTAGRSDIKESGHGSVMISFPGELPLRIRSIISMACPHTVVMDVEEAKSLSKEAGSLSDTILVGSLIKFLSALLANASKANQKAESSMPRENTYIDEEYYEEDYDKESSYDSENDDRFIPESEQTYDADDAEGLTNNPGRFRDMEVKDLDLSVRATNCLLRANICTLKDLLNMTEDEVHNLRNMGRKACEEIKEALKGMGLMLRAENEKKICYNLESLNEMIGLEGVKAQIRKLTAFAKLKKGMADQGMKMQDTNFSMAFLGNPGTAKTTVARIVAGIFKEIGLLKNAVVHEVGRSDLVGEFVGRTAVKTKRVFEDARGGILFIDEAYSLVDDFDNSYGDEAINTIVQEMENNRADTIVIFAGYPDKMEAFFTRNPGLKSRVPFKICFDDYSAEEMCQIAELEAKKRGFTIAPSAYDRLKEVCETAVGNTEAGNGRFCRNLIENSIMEYALRAFENPDSCNSQAENSCISVTSDGCTEATEGSSTIGSMGSGTIASTGNGTIASTGSGTMASTGNGIGNLVLQACDLVITGIETDTKPKNVIGF